MMKPKDENDETWHHNTIMTKNDKAQQRKMTESWHIMIMMYENTDRTILRVCCMSGGGRNGAWQHQSCPVSACAVLDLGKLLEKVIETLVKLDFVKPFLKQQDTTYIFRAHLSDGLGVWDMGTIGNISSRVVQTLQTKQSRSDHKNHPARHTHLK